MVRTRFILAALPPLCGFAAIVLAIRIPIPPQSVAPDLSPLISELQGTFDRADLTGSIEATGTPDTAIPGNYGSSAIKIPPSGQPKRGHKTARTVNQTTGYKPDITPPNFTNSAY